MGHLQKLVNGRLVNVRAECNFCAGPSPSSSPSSSSSPSPSSSPSISPCSSPSPSSSPSSSPSASPSSLPSGDYLQYQVVISGIIACNGHCVVRTGASGKVTGISAPNGIFILTRTYIPSFCFWEYIEVGNFGTHFEYTDEEDCTGANTPRSLTEFRIQLYRTSSTRWVLYVRYYHPEDDSYFAGMYRERKDVDAYDCSETVFSNPDETNCDPGKGVVKQTYNAGIRGTITVTPYARGHLAKCPG